MFVRECICMCVISDGAQTRRLSSTSPSLSGWPVAGGGRGTGAATTIICFCRCPVGGCAHREDCSFYWLSPGKLAMLTMLYYVAVSGAKLPTQPRLCLTTVTLLLRNASATGLQLDMCV